MKKLSLNIDDRQMGWDNARAFKEMINKINEIIEHINKGE